ncbi:MAG: hypothetical protein EHM72_13980 [Calditrichaeota bacterium]|nr:MAG: hypothetical protein EHM72_13980 [Calditrichota bacterium]
MAEDISQILKNWPFNDQDLNVRFIEGNDGRQKIQMRLDLGLLQMEIDGRPDGKRPRNSESYLDYFENRAQQTLKNPERSPFKLSASDCFKLQQEAVQYYHRYLALMKLQDFNRVLRDTQRNLKVFDFVEKYSDNDEVVWQFQQHRPYVIMMNVRAQALALLQGEQFETALEIISEGIHLIEQFNEKWSEHTAPDHPELEFLQYWHTEIASQKPMTEKERLNLELQEAVDKENYERAAELRDKLASLEKALKL